MIKGEVSIAVENFINSNDTSQMSAGQIAKEVINLNKWTDKKQESVRAKVKQVRKRLQTSTTTNQYQPKQNYFSAKKPDGTIMHIDEYCSYYGLPRNHVKSYKLVTHTATPFYNIAFYEQSVDIQEDKLESILDKLLTEKLPTKKKTLPIKKSSDLALRVIYTDVHIGMEVNPEGKSLYGGKWDAAEVEERRKQMILDAIYTAKKNGITEIYLDDLGDFMDGLNGYTTRGGHQLPQNMSNEEAFECGVKFKTNNIHDLFNEGYFSKIVCNDITDDNHSGDFGYFVSSAANKILSAQYEIEYNTHTHFIPYYGIGEHGFMLCHGKDRKDIVYNLKPKLDAKGLEFISQYIKNMDLQRNYKWLSFDKGDSHQCLFDYCTSEDFDYMNYPAFSRSSAWVQKNFKRGRSGYVLQIVNKNKNEKDTMVRYFDW